MTAPIVFNSAHSGRNYPERFLEMTRLDELSIRQSEDAYVDELFGRAPHLGTPLLRAHFPRAYLDVNREPWELDPQMFAEPLSDRFNTTSPRVAAGLGTIARVVAENKPIYRERLTLDDARMRIEGIYIPYHATLQRLLTDAAQSYRRRCADRLPIRCRAYRAPATASRPTSSLATATARPAAPGSSILQRWCSPVRGCASPATAPMPAASSRAPMAARSTASTRCRSKSHVTST